MTASCLIVSDNSNEPLEEGDSFLIKCFLGYRKKRGHAERNLEISSIGRGSNPSAPTTTKPGQ